VPVINPPVEVALAPKNDLGPDDSPFEGGDKGVELAGSCVFILRTCSDSPSAYLDNVATLTLSFKLPSPVEGQSECESRHLSS
jgi:hypothetical protein